MPSAIVNRQQTTDFTKKKLTFFTTVCAKESTTLQTALTTHYLIGSRNYITGANEAAIWS